MGLLGNLFQSVADVEANRHVVARRRYGVIEVLDQRLKAIHFRPYPSLISVAEIRWSEIWNQRNATTIQADRVMLHFNQPLMHSNFMALDYFVSDYKATLASIAVCLSVLDWVAKVKRTDAIVTEITNKRIKDRHLQHFGWERHLENRRKRHWIKRFYGEYPDSYLFQTTGQPVQDSASNTGPTYPPTYITSGPSNPNVNTIEAAK